MNIQSYVDLGWSIIPVKGPKLGKDYDDSKRPLLSWKPYQSRKPTSQEIQEWQQKTPKMSLAAVTGPINNFIIVDIDSSDWMIHFPDADFGITWKSKSTRGCHFYYKWEDWMLDIPSTRSEIGDIKGLDIRGQGGYAIVPNDNDPSRSWEVHPSDQPLLTMPNWIKTVVLSEVKNRQENKKVVVSEISEGNRHQSFVSLAGKLNRANFSPSDIANLLIPLAEKSGFGDEIEPLITDVINRYPIERRNTLSPESMEQLLSEPEPALEWLIEGLWTDKARGFIAGHPGTGKTWIALDMILSVATGGLCLGKYKPAYTAPCLIVEEEASRRNLQRRIHALARARQIQPQQLRSVFHITQQFTNLPRDAEQLTAFIIDKGIKFVVFDSLREVHSAKENSSDEMAVVLKAFKEISVVGNCAVLLIHHLSKSGMDSSNKSIFERMRGTGSLWAWRDCILGIEGEEESTVAKCTFQFRDADSPSPIKITRHVGATTGAIALEAVSLEESLDFMEKAEEVISFIKSQFGGVSANKIVKEIGGKKTDVLALIRRLQKLGKIVKSGSNLVVPE